MYKNMLKSFLSSKRNLEKNDFKEYNKNRNDVNSIFLNIHNQRTSKINFIKLYTFNNNFKEKSVVIIYY